MAGNVNLNSIINLNIPAVVPDGFQNPEVRSAVEMFLNSMNNLLRSVEQYSGITQKDITTWNSIIPSDTLLRHQLGRFYVEASEDIPLNNFINLHNVAGVTKARKAQGTAGTVRKAHGFCSTTGGMLTGNIGEVILSQGLVAIGGVAPGQDIFLSLVAGVPGLVALTGAGQLEQYLGTGVATNLVYIDISMGQFIQH